MHIIIGFGNKLRGEDAFGVDVISQLQKLELKNIKLISTFQLTPELSLELQSASRLTFVDAAFCENFNYSLACSLEESNENLLSHHISIKTILVILEELYNSKPKYEVYSMTTNNFEKIVNKKKYDFCIEEVKRNILLTI